MKDHPDFDLPWCKKLLSDPNVKLTQEASRIFSDGQVSNSMFKKLLYKPGALQAHVLFRRPTQEPDAMKPTEECMLLSVSNDIDGKTGRAHGGLNSLVLDQVCGSCAHHAIPSTIPPATATLIVDYKAPVPTPCVVLARAWVVEMAARKIWIRSVLQDGDGKVLAAGRVLYISARTTPSPLL